MESTREEERENEEKKVVEKDEVNYRRGSARICRSERIREKRDFS